MATHSGILAWEIPWILTTSMLLRKLQFVAITEYKLD